jgi:lipid-binding SYLF domain-containing protein
MYTQQEMQMDLQWGLLTLALAVLSALHTAPALAASASEIDQEATVVLQELYTRTEGAKILGEKAKGILIFPKIVKGGCTSVAYYRSVAASYGLQAGVQTFGYVLMFMDDAALAYLDQSDGWEIGVGPSIVVVDQGMGKSLSSTTLHSGVYAFIFEQKGLMAGLGLQGSKITKITPDK